MLNKRRSTPIFYTALAVVAMLAGSITLAQSNENKPAAEASGTTRLRVEVTGGDTSSPVDMASVYVKFVTKRTLAKDAKTEMNVKTNREGVAVVPVVPRGKIILQVVANGWKPYGENFDLAKDEEVLRVHLVRPPKWY